MDHSSDLRASRRLACLGHPHSWYPHLVSIELTFATLSFSFAFFKILFMACLFMFVRTGRAHNPDTQDLRVKSTVQRSAAIDIQVATGSAMQLQEKMCREGRGKGRIAIVARARPRGHPSRLGDQRPGRGCHLGLRKSKTLSPM